MLGESDIKPNFTSEVKNLTENIKVKDSLDFG
jgi:hypothetical protein